jgi:hypothetical protein
MYIFNSYHPTLTDLQLRSEPSALRIRGTLSRAVKSLDSVLEVAMSKRLRVLVVAAFILGMTWVVRAQAPGLERVKIDVSKLGPQVNEQVPDFSLKDQAGKTWTRSSIMGSKGAMLVFIRSAEW